MKYLLPIFLIVFILIPLIVQAQEAEIMDLFTRIKNILVIVGMSIAVIVIVVSGIMYLTAGGDETRITKAKKTLTYGIVGAAIIFAAGWIIYIVERIIQGAGGWV